MMGQISFLFPSLPSSSPQLPPPPPSPAPCCAPPRHRIIFPPSSLASLGGQHAIIHLNSCASFRLAVPPLDSIGHHPTRSNRMYCSRSDVGSGCYLIINHGKSRWRKKSPKAITATAQAPPAHQQTTATAPATSPAPSRQSENSPST